MLIAVPSDAPGGLDSTISEHFGHCGAFTIIEVEDGKLGEVVILENGGHEHGGCMAPVQLLKEKGVEVGSMLATQDQHGRQIPLTVVEIDDDTAKLDGNHPFAGKDVVFKVTVANVENATAEELAHNHAH